MYKKRYITPETLDRIERRVRKIEKAHPDEVQHWQLWQMVATIESGLAKDTRYHGDGLNMSRWSGRDSTDLYSARQGFYRMEKYQLVGWTLWVVFQKPADERAFEFVRVMHGVYRLYEVQWEDEPMVNGWTGYADYATEELAREVASQIKEQHGTRLRSLTLQYSHRTGYWRLGCKSTMRPNMVWAHRGRIPKKAKEII